MKTKVKMKTKNLPLLAQDVIIPTYDRSKVKAGIVHIGIGGFHRAHQAFYTDELLQNHGVLDFGICGICLLDSDRKIYNILKDQDGLYTLLTKELDGSLKTRVIGSIVEFLFAPDHPAVVIEKMADPEIKIISLTITEVGYNYNETTGEFDFSTPSIHWDLNNPNNPKTVFGFITQSLKLRKARKTKGCAIQSCDNIQRNGEMTKKMLCSYISKAEPDLLEWVFENVSFPSSMVDRITPITVEADIAILQEKYQIDDQWPVVCESFTQWIIEDEFIVGRPPWELAGAQFVKNVGPFENMKLSLLNAGHSILGILGALHGYDFIDEAARDKEFQVFLRFFMDNEVTPVLKDLDNIDLDKYKDGLIARFKNEYIKDQISRICLESSAKIPKFLLPTLIAQLKEKGPIAQATFVVAAWCKYNEGVDEIGRTYEINDVISDILKKAAVQSHKDPISFLKIESVFGDLVQSKRFVEAYTDALNILSEKKIKTCVKEFNS